VTGAEDILNRFKIVPTERRVVLLKLILSIEKQPFSVQALDNRIQSVGLAVSYNTLVTTLLLFATRKLLRAFPAPKTEKKKGRPAMLYMLDPSVSQSARGAEVGEGLK
jgi:hypothetical protein